LLSFPRPKKLAHRKDLSVMRLKKERLSLSQSSKERSKKVEDRESEEKETVGFSDQITLAFK
jgi:hypothetical protein